VEYFIAGAVVISLGSVVLTLRVAKFAARSLPQAHIDALNACRTEVAQLRTAYEDIATRVTSWKVELENLLEQVDASLELTERKRRSLASSASKIKAAEDLPTAPPVMNRQELEREARARGLL